MIGAYLSGIYSLNSQPPLLVARFMLNLRQLDEEANTTTRAEHQSFSALNFRHPTSRILGNVGEPIDDGETGCIDSDDATASTDNRSVEHAFN